MNRKQIVRKFYEQEYLKFRELYGWEEPFIWLKHKNQIAETGYGLYEDMSEEEIQKCEQNLYKKESPSPLSLSIGKLTKVPDSLLKACDRINWYLKHSLGELIVVKFIVDSVDTFSIWIQGYAGDGWDNECELVEIWDSSGDFIGSANPPSIDDYNYTAWNWRDRPIEGNDFNSPAPKW